MAGGYVSRLLNPAETLNVLREIPLRTGDHHKESKAYQLRQNAEGEFLRWKDRGGEAYHSVKKPDRICYFDLTVAMHPSKQLQLHLESESVSATLKTGMMKKAKELRPCYYLPYMKNGTTRMKLAPHPTYTGEAPRFFATAAIDGCSVYVEGPPHAPKVSHLNASNIAPAPVKSEDLKAETDFVRQARILQKIQTMDVRMNAIKKAEARVVERQHYIEDFADGKGRMKRLFALRKGIAATAVLDYQPFGCVIGIRTKDAWTFYLQKCGVFLYKLPNITKTQEAAMVISANEFWPTNVGGVRIFN